MPGILQKMKAILLKIFWGTLDAVVIIAVVVLLRTFLVSPFSVLGESMVSTFENGDLILIDKLSHRFSEPERGEVVVFYPPIEKYTFQSGAICKAKTFFAKMQGGDIVEACKARDFFIKRIIGIPGDTVEIWNGDVYVTPEGGEKTKIRDDFLDEKNQGQTCIPATNCVGDAARRTVFSVPEGSVFVLGDNRRGSSDSRAWKEDGVAVPFVPFENINGKVRIIFWPISDMGWVGTMDLFSGEEKALDFPDENTENALAS